MEVKILGLFDVRGKVIIITGGNRNIGLAVAKGFAELGAKVVIANSSRKRAEDAINMFTEKGYDFLWQQVDVSDSNSVRKLFNKVIEKYGRVDILFNNAGVRVNQKALGHEEDRWDWLFDINVKGTMLCCQEAAKIMKKQGYGKIINTSSISAYRGQIMRSSYCASKGAVTALTAALAVEWSKYGININAVAWGGVDIEQTPKEDMSLGQLATLAMTPLKKLLDADGLIGPVVFLASDASKALTGQTILIDGGWSILGKPDLSEL